MLVNIIHIELYKTNHPYVYFTFILEIMGRMSLVRLLSVSAGPWLSTNAGGKLMPDRWALVLAQAAGLG